LLICLKNVARMEKLAAEEGQWPFTIDHSLK
jgi:hypothetical protein